MLNQTIRTADQQVNSIRLNGSSQGLPVALGWGRNRVPGNLIWYGAFTATAQRTSQGGKGGPAMENTTYSYTAALVFAMMPQSLASSPAAFRTMRLYPALVATALVLACLPLSSELPDTLEVVLAPPSIVNE